MSDWSELKRLAQSATAYAEEDWHTPERLFIAMEKADAEFVSGCSPFSVLALIGDLKKIEADRRACWAEFKVMGRHVDQLKAENEALRKQVDDMSPFKGAPMTGPDLKCMACGGCHYGMSGLPCPKMAPTVMSQGENPGG